MHSGFGRIGVDVGFVDGFCHTVFARVNEPASTSLFFAMLMTPVSTRMPVKARMLMRTIFF